MKDFLKPRMTLLAAGEWWSRNLRPREENSCITCLNNSVFLNAVGYRFNINNIKEYRNEESVNSQTTI